MRDTSESKIGIVLAMINAITVIVSVQESHIIQCVGVFAVR